MQSPFLQSPPKSSSQPEGEHIKKDKGKKALSLEEAEKVGTNSDSNDVETHVTGSIVESSRIKKVKKFDFVIKDGKHIHLTEEQINQQKKIDQEAKAEAAKRESEVRKEELVNLLGLEVVNKYYNDKLLYDRYCEKMLNRRAESRITNYDVFTRKGPITLKVYREDGTSEIIPNFKASDLHLGEWRGVMNACPNKTGKGWITNYDQIRTRMDYIHITETKLDINLDIPLSEQDPLDKLNDLANKKRKHADDIHDYFKANKRLKSSVKYEDHLVGIVLNEPVLEIFFRYHQVPRMEDHARTFSSLLLAEVDKRNLNPLKHMRVIDQLRQLNKVYKAGKDMLYVEKNKADILGKVTSKVVKSLSSKEIAPQLSFNHLAIPQAREQHLALCPGSELTFLAGSELRTSELDISELKTSDYRFLKIYILASYEQELCKEEWCVILKSIDEGPFQMGTFQKTLTEGIEGALHLGPERPRVYSDLSPEDKERYNADIRATNILLQGLPKDIYTLINHYTNAKDIWDNVKMLLEGLELTKEDRESQLYNDFEHFHQHKGETIYDYYIWFAKLINDMHNIKMTMSRMQLNSKFVNNMLPKWGRFVIAVKLNRGLRDSNYDQLYAYLKQHEAHANENKMMLERFTQPNVDPLALMTNVSHQNQATVHDSRVVVQNVQGRHNRGQRNNARGAGAAGYEGVQNRVRNVNPGQAKQVKCYNYNGIGHIARNCTQPKRLQNFEYFKDKMLLMQAQENGVALDEEQLLFISGGQDNAIDEDVDEQPVQDLALNMDNVFQADDCDAFDSDVDEAPTAQTMFMANLSSVDPVYDEAGPSYDSDILSEYIKDNVVPVVQSNVSSVPNDAYMMIFNDMHEPHAQSVSDTTRNTIVDNSLTAELVTYKEQVELYERRASHKNPLCLTRARKVQPALYNGYEIIKNNHVPALVHNTEDTLEIAEITRRKMNDKMKDPECVTYKVKIASHDYLKENYLATFTPHKQLTLEQIFWSQDLIKMKEKALKK
ncbi:hypothetical protein Tco_0442567 [Tanacetum coccineum]